MKDSPAATSAFPANPSVAIDHISRVLGQYDVAPDDKQTLVKAVSILIEIEEQ